MASRNGSIDRKEKCASVAGGFRAPLRRLALLNHDHLHIRRTSDFYGSLRPRFNWAKHCRSTVEEPGEVPPGTPRQAERPERRDPLIAFQGPARQETRG